MVERQVQSPMPGFRESDEHVIRARVSRDDLLPGLRPNGGVIPDQAREADVDDLIAGNLLR